MVDDDDELATALRELTRTIDELRLELDDSRRRSPLGPPRLRPPTPGELLRLTDEVAVPALLAALEASVRTLEAFQRGLKIVRTEREVRDQVRTKTGTAGTGERAAELRQTTLSQLDTVLERLQRAVSEGALPADSEARDLLTEARKLRADVDRRLQATAPDRETDANEGETIEIDIDEPDGDRTDGGVAADEEASSADVDVDAELETLKDRYADRESESETDVSPGADDASSEDASGDHADTATGEDEPDSDGTDSATPESRSVGNDDTTTDGDDRKRDDS